MINTPASIYEHKLITIEWNIRRIQILVRDGFKCVKCGVKGNNLHVHHKRYSKSYRNPWEYPDNYLVTLCPSCHKELHDKTPASSLVTYDNIPMYKIPKNILDYFYSKRVKELTKSVKKKSIGRNRKMTLETIIDWEDIYKGKTVEEVLKTDPMFIKESAVKWSGTIERSLSYMLNLIKITKKK